MKSVSFYHSNINRSIIESQKAVFDHFGMEHEQILTTLTHGEAIDHYLLNNEWNEIAIFDIDCIPLNKDVIRNAVSELGGDIAKIAPINSMVLYGAAQKANHIPDSKIYCSPAFCVFSRYLWENTGRATFEDIPGFDVGGYFSYIATASVPGGINMRLIYPSHCEVPMWDLEKPKEFGLGTTYGNEVYHSFLSRQGNQQRFLNKCKEVING